MYRMTQRADITFYDSYFNNDDMKSVHINNENFYLFFAVYDEDNKLMKLFIMQKHIIVQMIWKNYH